MVTTKLLEFQYHKNSNDVSTRKVIPFSDMQHLVGLDVSAYTDNQVEQLREISQEYIEYRENIMKTIFSFEDWLLHTNKQTPPLKFRNFLTTKIKDLKEL